MDLIHVPFIASLYEPVQLLVTIIGIDVRAKVDTSNTLSNIGQNEERGGRDGETEVRREDMTDRDMRLNIW